MLSLGGSVWGPSDRVCPCAFPRRSRTRRPCRQRCVTCGSTTSVCRRSRGRRRRSCAGSRSGSSAPSTRSRSPCPPPAGTGGAWRPRSHERACNCAFGQAQCLCCPTLSSTITPQEGALCFLGGRPVTARGRQRGDECNSVWR